MRLKPRFWFLISLLLFAAAICTWQYADKQAASRHTPQSSAAPALPHPPLIKAAAATNAEPKEKSYRITNTTQKFAQLLHNSHAILLRNALIDTEVPVRLKIPEHLRAKGAPGSYLVQADRPLDKAFYAELSKAGATYVSYVPNNTALVQASPTQATNLAAFADIVAVLPYEPYYKLDSTLLPSAVEQQPQTNALSVTTFPGQRDAALAALTQLGATLIGEDRSPFGPTLVVNVPEQSLVAVAQMPLAQEIEAYSPRRVLNDLTRVLMNEATNTLIGTPNYLNLTGQGVTVNINDTGVDATHPDLGPAGRLLGDGNPASLADPDGHGTHVAGIIAGNGSKSATITHLVPGSIIPGASFRGKATNATLFSQSLDLYFGPFVSDAFLQENASSNLGPTNLISNNSWGYPSTVYDTHAASYDAATRDAQPGVDGEQPLLFVFAAGNNGNNSGSITSPATAKNVITVGASDSPRYITNMVSFDGVTSNEVFYGDTSSSNTVASFSSCGNVDAGLEGTYGRFKPDVVAPGVFTVSCRATNYVDPTNETTVTDHSYPNQTVALHQTNSNYAIFIPDDTSGVTVVISSNAASPIPFPTNMVILASTTFPPTNVVSSNNVYNLTNFNPGELWYFGVTSPTNQPGPVNYNLDIYLYETNSEGDYFTVLSNLNSVLKPWYLYGSGTSMSAGAVSGTLALMQEFLQSRMNITNPSPALLKAMLINGSRSMGLPYDFYVNALGANEQGWGLPSLPNIVPASLTNANPSMVLVDQSASTALATGQYQTFTISCADSNASVSFPLRVSLVWTDPPGNPNAGVALVNNLDLTVADATGTNIYIGNDFLSGDIFTEISNPTNLPAGQSDNTVQNIYVNNGTASFTSAGDSINNVQNVYISPTNGPIQFPLTITVSGTRVNVNAVPGQTNNIVQDYALVVSSDDPALTAPLTIATNAIVNIAPVLVTVASNGVPLLHQRVGANEPNLYNYPLGATNGNPSQWHFFVFTNDQFSATNQATNVAFATFLPPNLSIPRNNGADIDLYVSTNPLFTNLVDSVVQAADKSVGRTGNESIIYSNSTAGEVYYIGVKSEDQQAADFGFYGIAQQAPFSDSANGGNTITATGTSLPVFIPNSLSPTPALVFAFLANPNPLAQKIRRVTVTLGVAFPTPGSLYGTLQHNELNTVLNDFSGNNLGFTNTYDDLHEDPNSGDLGSDGPGSLTQYVGQTASGLWLLSEANDDPSLTGYVTAYTITVDLQQPHAGGFFVTIGAGDWYDDYILVPNDATNLLICASYENDGTNQAGTGPIGIYLTNNIGIISTTDYGSNGIVPPGGCLSLGTNYPVPGWPGAPPLAGGTWYYGIQNTGTSPVTLFVLIEIEESLTPNVVQTFSNNTIIPLTTDAHTQSQICVTNPQQLVDLQVGLRIADSNLDDLVIHLTSPEGTTVNLFEDRGGTNASGLGLTQILPTGVTTNTNGTSTTNYITNYVYTVFTEDTNLTTTPIKFGPPPYASINITPLAVLWSNSFETVSNGVYTNGAILEGWLVTNNIASISTTNGPGFLTNDEVGIVTDPVGEQIGATNLGSNYLALTSGHIIQTFGATNPPFTKAGGFSVTNGQPYQLVFYAKPMGVIDWWPADNNTDDIVGTNNGTIPDTNNVTYTDGEVDRAWNFSGLPLSTDTGNEVDFGTNAGNFGTNNFTVDFWIKQPPSATGEYGVLERRPICQASNFWDIRSGQVDYGPTVVNGSLGFELASTGADDTLESILTSHKSISDGLFHHVACVRQGPTNLMYIDGLLDNAITNPGTANINNSAMFKAGQNVCVSPGVGGSDTTQPFPGELDELDLIDRALSPAEVYAIYHAGSLGKYNTNSLFPNFQLTIDGVETNDIVLTNFSGGWQLFTNSFTATNNQITVEFSGNAMGVLLDDIQLVQLPATNYNNYYLPEEPLSPFIGENPLGCWTLDVWDTRQDSTQPTDGTLLSWTLQMTTSSTNATLIVLTNYITDTITNLQSNTIAYFAVDVPIYAQFATNILTAISPGSSLTLFFDQDALPTGGLPGDVTLTNGVVPGAPSTNVLATVGVPPPLVPGQRYFLGVLNSGASPAKFSIQVDFNGTTNAIIPLTNEIAYTNIVGTNSIGTNGPEYYSFVVPTNAILVTFQILNPTNGEVNLYASEGLPLPGPFDFDYESCNSGSNDQFIAVTTNSEPVALAVASTNDVLPLSPTVWYLAAYNSAAVSNVGYTILATVVTNGQMNIIPLTNAIPYTNTAPPGYPSNLVYSFTISNNPSGVEFMVTNLTNTGNVQLLADIDTFPTPEESYAGSFNAGTAAQFIEIVPNSALPSLNGVWYLSVPNTSVSNVPYTITAITNFIVPPPNVPITWNGNISELWDVLATSNWVVTGSSPPTPYPYQNGSHVTFDDSATGTTTVNLTTTLTPASITNNNSLKTYTFIGSGSINGAPLTKNGSGALIIDNTSANNFSAVTLNAGTLQIGNNDANGSLGTVGAITDNGTLAFDRTDNFLFASQITGTGSLSQNGSGTLTLSGINSYTGSTFINDGTIVVGNTNALGSWNGGSVTIASGATLDLSGLSSPNGAAYPLFGAKQFNISGAGAGGNGAIINNGLFAQQGGLESIVLNADATLGGATRWDIRNGTSPTLNLGGFTLTKTGTDRISVVSATITSGNIIIDQGTLSFEGTPVFSPSPGTITVNSNGLVGQRLDTFGSFTRTIVLNGGGTVNLQGISGITYLDAAIQLSNNSYLTNNGGIEIFDGVISGPFALTNLGFGSNLLSATNTYTGTTFVAQGSLGLTNNGSITNSTNIIVASGATLDASQRVDQTLTLVSNQTLLLLSNSTVLGSNVIAEAGSTLIGDGLIVSNLWIDLGAVLEPGTNADAIGMLTVGATAYLGGTNYMKLNETVSPSNDMVTASNIVYGGTLIVTNLNTNGATTFVVGDSFVLYNVTNSSGAFSNIFLPPLPARLAWSNSFAINGPGILSVVVNTNYVPPLPIIPLTWSGAVNGNWDILTTTNWFVTTNPALPYPYEDGCVVTFDSNATGTTTVTLTTALSPASVFVNPGLPYTFIGSGGISGAPLTISGMLTIDNPANSFTTVTLTNGGSLQLGNNDTNGSLATSTGILGPGVFTNGGFLIFDRSDNVVVSNVITGPGSLSQIGSGELTLTGTNIYTNTTSVAAGTLALGLGGSIGNSAVTVSNGATLANASTTACAIGGATVLDTGAAAGFAASGPGLVGPINFASDLALNNNAITVNLTGSPLLPGVYRLMNCAGTLTGSAGPATVTGIGLADGAAATTSTTAGIGGHVDLVVSAGTAFSGLIPNPSIIYGTTNITLSGTVSMTNGATTNYAADGDLVSITINGYTVNGTISGGNGGFSINFNDPSLQTDGVAGSPYTITYSYAGNTNLLLSPAINTSTKLTVERLKVILGGTKLYDGTATVAASNLFVLNVVASDVVTVASGSAGLASPNVGVQPITSLGTLALGGAAAANYSLIGASGSVTVIAEPPFLITSEYVDSTGKNFIITWQSVPGTIYQVIAQANAGAPLSAWTNVGAPITATSTNTSATNPITQMWDFFEVKNAGASGPVASGPFSITSEYIDSTGSNIIITWQSTVNAVYHVVASTNISTPLSDWPNVSGAITATNASTTATNAITQPLDFFRVKSP